jgi:hypothetical protein
LVVVYVARGLTRQQAETLAYRRLRKQRGKAASDYRGFTYNPKTGRAAFT